MYIERATSQILYKFFVFHRQASPWRRCKKKSVNEKFALIISLVSAFCSSFRQIWISIFNLFYLFWNRVISDDGKRNISLGYFLPFRATTYSNYHRKLFQCYTYFPYGLILPEEIRNDVTHTFQLFSLLLSTSFFETYFAAPLLWLHPFDPIPEAWPVWHFLSPEQRC